MRLTVVGHADAKPFRPRAGVSVASVRTPTAKSVADRRHTPKRPIFEQSLSRHPLYVLVPHQSDSAAFRWQTPAIYKKVRRPLSGAVEG